MERIVVVTGASSGIGRELALQLAARGDTVVLAARREDALEETAERCRRLGGRASVVPTDFASITEGSLEDHRRVVETNLFGPIYGARAVVPHFRERGRGVLINVSSILG